MERERGRVSRSINAEPEKQAVGGSATLGYTLFMRALAPYVSIFMLTLQLVTGGLLGPRMVCTDSDGTQSVEWVGFSCCTFASVAGEEADAPDHDKCCPTECDGSRDAVDALPVIGNGGCGCVDVPAADGPVVRHEDSRPATNLLAAHLAAAIPTVFAWLEPVADGRPLAFLPRCHAPPREYIATVILRI